MGQDRGMQLLVRDGAPVPARAVPHDAEGARAVAELYAFGPGTTVRAMMNSTIDGAIAGADGTSGTLRNPDDSFVFGVLRALADVIVVGAATVRVEDYRRPRGRADLRSPSRRPSGREHPVLAILSRSGVLPEGIEPDWPTLLITPRADAREAGHRSGLTAEQVIPADTPAEVVTELSRRGLHGIQVEGGPSTLGRFAAADALDELCLSTSLRTVAGASPRVLAGPPHDTAWSLRSLLVGAEATCARYSRLPVDRG